MISLTKAQLHEAVQAAVKNQIAINYLIADMTERFILENILDGNFVSEIVETIQHQSLRCGGSYE